ncbi:hypothetical protein HED50_14565 [Ochrobactrum oryzae]|nr:hypothetical protein [Brucella oryzae]
MSAPTNDFKHRLKAGGECLHGIWLGFADPYATEMAAIAGFDWLLIDSEHGPERYHAFKPLDEPFLSAERPITLRREGSGLCFQAAAYQK